MKKSKFSRRDFSDQRCSRRRIRRRENSSAHASAVGGRRRRAAPSDKVRFGIIGVGCRIRPPRHIDRPFPTWNAPPRAISTMGATPWRGNCAAQPPSDSALQGAPRQQGHRLHHRRGSGSLASASRDRHRDAGKDIYCEKPMSHTAADGVAMVDARRNPIASSRSLAARQLAHLPKAKEMISQGMLGDLMLVEGWMGRNDPTGAWQYPPPFDLSPQTLDWDTWQGDVVPKRPFNPNLFARWRCWKEYGTGVAGDLLVHLISGMTFMLGISEPPRQASAVGGIRHWKDGRNMPDVHAAVYYYGDLPVYMRLNLATDMPEVYRFQ